ncbi:hypothetical protein WG922_07030 [Ramlibacter sp. AN1015]|uniref:hypothetical protein n=1 Tax=Ramlibacter sp. AN1015 TaxID=3133428 RepID=UPI0030C1C3CA
MITPPFAAVLLLYVGLTTAYTFFLKPKMLVDIIALASLYILRVGGGAAAIGVPISEWLLVEREDRNGIDPSCSGEGSHDAQVRFSTIPVRRIGLICVQ